MVVITNRITDLRGQLRLKLERAADFSRYRFIVSGPNKDAVQALDVWPDHRGGALALIGPEGVGKSHLASAWAARVGARRLTSADLDSDGLSGAVGPLLFDNADEALHGEAFFHLLNKVQQPDCCLLLTGRTPPSTWSADVPDVRSRLNALAVIELHAPDDAILRGVLLKMFDERHIRPPSDLIAYLLLRMERSTSAADAIVKALDETASATNRPISRMLAREILQDEEDGE